eukprot:2783885-Pyramimonas_sp.AAC.1
MVVRVPLSGCQVLQALRPIVLQAVREKWGSEREFDTFVQTCAALERGNKESVSRRQVLSVVAESLELVAGG